MIRMTLSYEDGHSNEVAILKDKKYNVFRYINLTKGHICTCFFPDIYSAIEDLIQYPQIEKVTYGTTVYSLDSFLYIMKEKFCISEVK